MLGGELDSTVEHNIKKLHTIRWLNGDLSILDGLSDLAQRGAVNLAMMSSISRQLALEVVSRLLTAGATEGRRAASEALSEFSGAEANELAITGLGDPDPVVQANVMVQLRKRGIPGALSRLVEKVDSPHAIVRDAVRASLSEFSVDRYLASFDILEEEARVATGALVRRIDPTLVPVLAKEMDTPSRVRRMRAIAVACTTGVAAELEDEIIHLLHAQDHILRAEAAEALSRCNTPSARSALWEATADRSVTVQEAARESLEILEANAESSQQGGGLSA
jgi:HEAT repeat protein